MDVELKGMIYQRLQVILTTSDNCAFEILRDEDGIQLGGILIDLNRIADNVRRICDIIHAAEKGEKGEGL
jgi:hypothetical protein